MRPFLADARHWEGSSVKLNNGVPTSVKALAMPQPWEARLSSAVGRSAFKQECGAVRRLVFTQLWNSFASLGDAQPSAFLIGADNIIVQARAWSVLDRKQWVSASITPAEAN
jgi:hypothetical protein